MTTVRWCGHLVSLRGARGGETVFDVPVDGGWRVAQPTSELGICKMQRCFSSTLAFACSQCLGCLRTKVTRARHKRFVFIYTLRLRHQVILLFAHSCSCGHGFLRLRLGLRLLYLFGPGAHGAHLQQVVGG